MEKQAAGHLLAETFAITSLESLIKGYILVNTVSLLLALEIEPHNYDHVSLKHPIFCVIY
jgi:hypothetical protein